jgi:DNA (cytosine-5)-methyltransferase 1
MNSDKTCLDLFAGAGGLTEGLRQAGFRSLFANEISPAYSQTLKNNYLETCVQTDDIRSLSANKIRKGLGLAKGELDLLAGGPPCQGFSVNAPIRCTSDERNHLFLDYLKFVEAFNPKVVLIENVPGMVSFEKGETVSAILASLKRLGYDATVRILFAAHYGVPQMRWRTIFIANRIGVKSADMYPGPSHFSKGRANFTTNYLGRSLVIDSRSLDYLPKNVTVAEAIGDLPVIENGGGSDEMPYTLKPQSAYQRQLRKNSDTVYNHASAGLGKANLERLPHIPPGGSWRDIPFDLLPTGMKRARRSDHTKRYGRLHPEGIGSTILTKCDPHWGTYIHPEQDRIISVREAARLQSFPDKFRFYGSLTEQYEQVGNAVPPLFARAIGESIHAYLSDAASCTPAKLWHVPQLELLEALA